jgi:hypothetical protein
MMTFLFLVVVSRGGDCPCDPLHIAASASSAL